MNARFKILAVNDDESTCCCCGKQDLKKVVWIEDTETGNLQHFGVICALNPTKAFGLTKTELNPFLQVFESMIKSAHRMAWRMYRAAGGEVLPILEGGREVGLKAVDRTAYQACYDEAWQAIKERGW